MFASLIRGLPDGELVEVGRGVHWNVVIVRVDGGLQCGLASNPVHADGEDHGGSLDPIPIEDTHSARALCELVYEQDSPQASIGLAAINALLPRRPETWFDANAGEEIVKHGKGKRVALVGHFPFVEEVRPLVGRLDVLELRPRDGDLPASAAPDVIPQADVVALTSMTLLNGTFQELIGLCSPQAYVIMIGPSTPLSPILFEHGVDLLCGSIVESCWPVLASVVAGLSFRKIKPSGVRLVSISRSAVNLF